MDIGCDIRDNNDSSVAFNQVFAHAEISYWNTRIQPVTFSTFKSKPNKIQFYDFETLHWT